MRAGNVDILKRHKEKKMTENKRIAGKTPDLYVPRLIFIETDSRGFAKDKPSSTRRYVSRDYDPSWSPAELHKAIKEIESESGENYTLEFAGIRPDRMCLFRQWDSRPAVLPDYPRETAVCVVFESIQGQVMPNILLKDISPLKSVSVKNVYVPGCTNDGIQVGYHLVTFRVQDLRKITECLDDYDKLEIFVRGVPSRPVKPEGKDGC
jgi:hypothetical protein